jgi:2-amino-4-hydroxy-6-hydroxymethyldihydropteridine diphosphokinase
MVIGIVHESMLVAEPDIVVAYLALGSNAGDRMANLRAAVAALKSTAGISVIAASPVYRSAAHVNRPGDRQPEFFNAVLSISTSLEPADLLDRVLDIERSRGRTRSRDGAWQPRSLDIDILVYGDEPVEEAGLSIPHPRIPGRRFVLQPLHDLAPHLHIPEPIDDTVSTLLGACTDDPVNAVPESDLLEPTLQAELWPDERKSIVSRRAVYLPDGFRYLVIEGVIGAGKTTLTKLIAERFGGQLVLEQFEENPFLERFYSDRPRWAFQTQLAFLASRFRQQQALARRDLFHETVVSDYAFDKDRIFARLNLTGDELGLYDTMFGIMAASVPKPDLVVYLQASTDRLMRLIADRGRPYEQDMDRSYIDSLNQAYEQFFFHYSATPLLIVNTEKIDFVKNDADLEELLGQVARLGYSGTTYYNPVRV